MSQLLSIESFFSSAGYIVIAVLVLLLMVTIHELGHYTAGKLLKFKINEFAIGFGKKLWSKKTKSGEMFSIRLFPLGGFCAFEGEDEERNENPEAFNKQAAWKRLIVLFSGAFFNIISAILFSMIFLMAYGYADRTIVTAIDTELRPSTQAAAEWIMPNDVIIGVGQNGEYTYTNFINDEYFSVLSKDYAAGEEFEIVVLRDGQEIKLKTQKQYDFKTRQGEGADALFSLNKLTYVWKIIPFQDETDGLLKYYLQHKDNENNKYTSDSEGRFVVEGISLIYDSGTNSLGIARLGFDQEFYKYGFFEAIGHSFYFTLGWAWKVIVILGQLITGAVPITDMGGPITTITFIAEATSTNWANFFLLLPLIAVNLGVFNLLPFPALDGARMIFVTLEAIFRKPVVNRTVEGYIHFGGLIVLFVFVIIIEILHFI